MQRDLMSLACKSVRWTFAGSYCAAFTACTTLTPVMSTGKGEYIVSRSGDSGFIAVGKLRQKVMTDVNEYAAQHNAVAEVISVNEVAAGFGVFPQVDVRFRLVANERVFASGKETGITVRGASDARGKTTYQNTTP